MTRMIEPALRKPTTIFSNTRGALSRQVEDVIGLFGWGVLAELDGRIRHADERFLAAAEGLIEETGEGLRFCEGFWRSLVVEMEGSQGLVTRHAAPDGVSDAGFRLRFGFVYGRDGAAVGVAGAGRDTSQLDAALKRAADARERFDDLARLVSDWIWECDREMRLTFVSTRVCDALGWHPVELVGRCIGEVGTFETTHPMAAAPGPDLRSPFRDQRFRVRRKDGAVHLFLLSGIPVFEQHSGDFQGFRGTAKDITSETEAWDNALRSQQRLIDAIESISDGFALFDAGERLVLCNSRMREFFRDAPQLVAPGNSVSDHLSSPGADEAQEVRQLGGGALEMRVGERWLRTLDHRTSDGDTVVVRTDITDLKARETALTRAKEEAELANRTKTEFLANMSHELRTPLNAIIGFAEIIRDELFGHLNNPRYTQYIVDIHDSARHLLNIINDILDVSKAEAGKLDLAESAIDVADITESACRLVRERAINAGLSLTIDLPAGLPQIFADERKIKQILLNLLSNAIKFTTAGGEVTVSARIEDDGGMAIVVSDSGIGMNEAEIEIALTPFGQVDSALHRTYEGTGLGLPLSKALAELHDARLEINSEKDVGTRVRLLFSAARVLDGEPT